MAMDAHLHLSCDVLLSCAPHEAVPGGLTAGSGRVGQRVQQRNLQGSKQQEETQTCGRLVPDPVLNLCCICL
jgi:hypothetical protein